MLPRAAEWGSLNHPASSTPSADCHLLRQIECGLLVLISEMSAIVKVDLPKTSSHIYPLAPIWRGNLFHLGEFLLDTILPSLQFSSVMVERRSILIHAQNFFMQVSFHDGECQWVEKMMFKKPWDWTNFCKGFRHLRTKNWSDADRKQSHFCFYCLPGVAEQLDSLPR